MALLKLLLFGPPRIERDGVPVALDTRKATALLAYLAITKQVHARDTLAALLWPSGDQTHARAALRRTLSTLKAALAGDWLIIHRENVALSDDGLWLDVQQFHGLLEQCERHGHPSSDVCPDCLGLLTEAANLYRADFLAGFTLRDSPEFDDWQSYQGELLRQQLAGVLDRLAYGHSAHFEWDQAILCARRRLELDPLHEVAHRTLMELYVRAGDRAAALRQYRECVRILDEELGVPPLAETTELHQAIVEGTSMPSPGVFPTSPIAAGSTMPAGGQRSATLSSRFPFVGRTKEWEALLDVYEAIVTDGHVVVVEGEAGIGKTRLVEEFLAFAGTRGVAEIATCCYEGEADLAYGPFVDALRAAMARTESARHLAATAGRSLSEAARLLPELADLQPDLPPLGGLDGPGAQSRFFEGLRDVFLACCGLAPPGILVVEDLQWADEPSLDLLTYLVRRLRGTPLCIVATWRSENVPAGHRLDRLLAEVERRGDGTHIALSRLAPTAVEELVRSVTTEDTGAAVSLSQRLYQETEGLAFLVTQYLTALTQDMQPADGGAWPLPQSARDLLRSRLAEVSQSSWQVLTAAAVIGRSFPFDVLKAASGRSEEEAVEALEELSTRELVREVRGVGSEQSFLYDFSHEKLRVVAYEETSLARRRLLHRRVAEALVRSTRGRKDGGAIAGQIAHHYQLAGVDQQAAEFFKLAGEHARDLCANVEAASQFQSALAMGHPLASELHEAIGDLRTLTGEYGTALTSYETAAALAEPVRLPIIEHKIGNLYHRRGESALAERHFAAALEEFGIAGREGERARLYADWSLTMHRESKMEQAIVLAEQAIALAETADDALALAQAHNILGMLASSRGDLEEAQDHLRRSLAIAENLGDLGARVAALNNLALAHRAGGDAEQALHLTGIALELCSSQGDRHREAALHNNLADLLHALGRAEDSMAHLQKAVSMFAEIGADSGTMQPEIWKLVEW